MIYIAYFILVCTFIEFICALINLLVPQHMNSISKKRPIVSILIPARNEENNISHTLQAIEKLSYPSLDIWVFDDDSTDSTIKIVKEFINHDSRIHLLRNQSIQGEGGKNYACHELSKQANGEFLIFIDADVQLHGTIIERTLYKMRHDHLTLLSIFPHQELNSVGEELTVRNMADILLTLLPLVFVQHSPFSAHSAANGQFMCFRTKLYRLYEPHNLLHNKVVEDIAIAKYLKQSQEPIACLIGEPEVTCNMYGNYKESIQGLARSFIAFFGGSILLASLYWAINLLGIIPIAIYLPWYYTILYVCLIIGINVVISTLIHDNIWRSLLLHYPKLIAMGHILYNSISNKIKHKIIWKGRTITSC